jgi:SAM-dependent methyltransferase
MKNTWDEHLEKNLEKPYYGYCIMKYITLALIAGGIVSIALAFVFTTWLSILCWVFRRCTFQNSSALDLPFEDGGSQLVVSAFVFHEVKVPDRTVLLKEAIRVLAPGGVFMICDLFSGSFRKAYKVKGVPELLEKVQRMGVEEVKFESLKEAGVNLGGLAHIWGIGYLSGRRV